MSEIQRCPSCNGFKRIIGMGMLEHKCTECSGVGFIEEKHEEKSQDVVSCETSENTDETVKRRGRKKKELNAQG